MAKINFKLDKHFLSELTGSLSKDALKDNKKLLGLFDIINVRKKDDTIDVKEIADFANSIFEADTNNDGEVDNKELKTFIKANEDTFKELKIKAKDIMEFFKTFTDSADKSDEKSRRINNSDGSYSLVVGDTQEEGFPDGTKKYQDITKTINYDKDGNITTIEKDNGTTKVITDAKGKTITTQLYKDGVLASEVKADGLAYYYDGNKTTIKNGFNETVTEIETLESGKRIIKEFDNLNIHSGKIHVTTTNEETGEVSKETIYKDNYYIHINEHHVIALDSIKSLINNPISSNSFYSLDYMGKDAVKIIASEDDANFQKTYITGIVNKITELAELIGENTNEIKAIQKEIQEKGFENVSIESIQQAYSKLFEKIKQTSPQFETSKISNKYYTSQNSYTKITTNNKIVITDTDNITVIDKNKLLRVYSKNDKQVMWDVIKDFSAEALFDLAAEVTFQNIRETEGADASFDFVLDKINIGEIVLAEYILHEMGHAIDCLGKGNENKCQTKHNVKFKQTFKEEMYAYIKAGNKRCKAYYDSKGAYQTTNDTLANSNSENDSTYATVDEQEMFAECYALLMGGTCQSEEVISKYFKNTLACVQEMVENTRTLSNNQRH